MEPNTVLLKTHKDFEEEVEVVEEPGAGVVYQGLGHGLVAEELAGEALLHLEGHNAGLEVVVHVVGRLAGFIKPCTEKKLNLGFSTHFYVLIIFF